MREKINTEGDRRWMRKMQKVYFFFIERPKGPDNCCATSMIIEGSLGKLKVGTMLTSYLQ